MNDDNQNCDACGSSRVASGILVGGDFIGFKYSELNGRYWCTLSNVSDYLSIHQDGVRACLDCGKVTASLSVDVEEAKAVLNQWGSDALKSRLNAGIVNASNTQFLQHWSRVRGRGFAQYTLVYDIYGLMIGLGVALLGPLIRGTSYGLNEITHWLVPPLLGCVIIGGLVGAVRWVVMERRYRALRGNA